MKTRHDSSIRWSRALLGAIMTAFLPLLLVGCGGGGAGGGVFATPQNQVSSGSFATVPTTAEVFSEFTPVFVASSNLGVGVAPAPLSGLSIAAAYQKGTGNQVTFPIAEVGTSGVYLAQPLKLIENGNYNVNFLFTAFGEVVARSYNLHVESASVTSGTQKVDLSSLQPSLRTTGPLSFKFKVTQSGTAAASLTPAVYLQDPSGRITDLVLGDDPGELTNDGGGSYTAVVLAANLPLASAGEYDLTFDSNGVTAGGDLATFRLDIQ